VGPDARDPAVPDALIVPLPLAAAMTAGGAPHFALNGAMTWAMGPLEIPDGSLDRV
jgi:hypothetical protein